MTLTIISAALSITALVVGWIIKSRMSGKNKVKIKNLEKDVEILDVQNKVKPHRSFADIRKWMHERDKD